MASRRSYFVENEQGACRLCTRPDEIDDMVRCDECDRWFHASCVKVIRLPDEDEEFVCVKCRNDRAEYMEISQSTNQDTTLKALIEALKMSGLTSSTHIKRMTLNSLPNFNGTSKDWPKFKRAFEETTEEGSFSNVENLNRLQHALKGEAERCVRRLFLEPDNVPIIMKKLEEQFGRPEQVYQDLLGEVLKVRVENQMKIPDLSDALEDMIINLKAIKKEGYLQDHRLVDELIFKFSTDKQLKWIEFKSSLEKKNKIPTLEHFSEWLYPIAENIRKLPKRNERFRQPVNFHRPQFSPNQQRPAEINNNRPMNRPPQPHNSHPMNTQTRPFNTRVRNVQRFFQPCPCCQGSHALYRCERFKNIPVHERLEIVVNSQQCQACLTSNNHSQNNCNEARECGIQGCRETHHQLLHTGDTVRMNYHQTIQNVYYQIVPVVLRNNNHTLETYAFLDAGSSLTLIEENTANKLHLNGVTDPLTLTWTQNLSVQENCSRRVSCMIKGMNEKKEHLLNGIRTVKNLQLPSQTLSGSILAARYPHLKGIKLSDYQKARPTVLIGLNHSHLLMPLGRKMGRPEEPMAIKTKLGWLIFGIDKICLSETNHLMIHKSEDLMTEMMRQYFSTEEFGVKPVKTVKSQALERAETIIEKTLKKTDGRYEVGLLWRDDNVILPNSYSNALRRLATQEKQLAKDPGLKNWLCKTFEEYQQKGYIRKLTKEELKRHSQKIFYIPHFVVVNKNKPIPKPRRDGIFIWSAPSIP
ncbi:uncharacterized protein LOC121587900 [Anopheles merus]|uniref:uncharacterized protein LOC121587900 n=1 Tax=Anopheles merus TaxID=30066 RepID=UPI001BE4A049|nr:uncharacterized protein LOC121587900 [Anopheles merus]